MAETPSNGSHARWVAYRPDIKVLDCTIRDGGLVNDHAFDDKVVKAVYDASSEAGVDYIEVGYKASKKIFSPTQFGKWKFCDEDDIRRIVGEKTNVVRITVTGVLYETAGPEWAEMVFHDLAGWFMMPLAVLLLWLEMGLLSLWFRPSLDEAGWEGWL